MLVLIEFWPCENIGSCSCCTDPCETALSKEFGQFLTAQGIEVETDEPELFYHFFAGWRGDITIDGHFIKEEAK